jgi:sulfatase maturation enzyme AslB (radical SAM superfamily)
VTLYNLSDESKLVKAAKDSDWIDTRILLELFERFAPELDELHFAGGEPFLISAMFDVLRYLVDRGLASRISLAYVSNLTAFPEALRDLWPHFKGVRLSVSLDGHERVNSYIRFPSVWKSLQANLRTVDSDANTLNFKTLRFYTTVQVYNVFSLPDLFDYIFETFSLFDPFPNLIIVQEPSCFDIQVLPQQLKSAITARYHDYIESRSAVWRSRASTSHISEFTTKLEGVIRHMNEFDASFRIPEFVRRTNLHDAYRQQRASELIPELLPLFDMA